MATHRNKQTETPRQAIERDPAGRYCSYCAIEIQESIPLDGAGTCHGCGRNFGKAPKRIAVIGNGLYARMRSHE